MNHKFNFKKYKKDNTKKTYNKFYKERDFVKFPIADKHFIKSLVKKYKLENDSKILDIGCGTGKYTNLLTKEGMDVIGVDISSSAIEIAKKSYPKSKFKVGDATNLDFPKNNFDVILCSGFSAFNEKELSRLTSFIEYLLTFLKKDGLFIFVKTTSLTDKPSKGNTRFDHSLNSYENFFKTLKNTKTLGSYTTYPHTFILFRKWGFSKIISKISNINTRITKIPLRAYIILKKV